jgi:hypothetical protein
MSGAIPPLLQYASMAWCLFKKHRDNFKSKVVVVVVVVVVVTIITKTNLYPPICMS